MRDFKNMGVIFATGFKYLWRNPLGVTVISLFPILLILILGSALSSYISPETDFDAVSVAYVTDNEYSIFAELLKEDFSRFISAEFTNEDAAFQMLAEEKIHVIIYEIEGDISVLKSDFIRTDTNIVLSIIDSYKKNATAVELAIANGRNPVEVMSVLDSNFAVEAKPIGGRVPTATDYYAVTMIVYMLLIAGINGIELFNKGLLSDTGARIATAPVSRFAQIGGLLAASTATSFLQGMLPFTFAGLVYGVYWGERIWLVLLALFAVVLFSQAFCIFLLLLSRNTGAAMGIMQAVLWVTTFISGGYMKITFGEQLDRILAYAPNALAHTTIFGAIYGGNEAKIMSSLAILFAMSAVFFGLAFVCGSIERRRFS